MLSANTDQPSGAFTISNTERSIGPSCTVSPVSLPPLAHVTNSGRGSVALGRRLVAGSLRPPVESPQATQRVHLRCKRDFLSHGIDNPIEFNFAHRTLHCSRPAFCRQDDKDK